MTTTLRNVEFLTEIRSFKKGSPAVSACHVAYALADLLKANGPAWLLSDDARALLLSLNRLAYGPCFSITAKSEEDRLDPLYQ